VRRARLGGGLLLGVIAQELRAPGAQSLLLLHPAGRVHWKLDLFHLVLVCCPGLHYCGLCARFSNFMAKTVRHWNKQTQLMVIVEPAHGGHLCLTGPVQLHFIHVGVARVHSARRWLLWLVIHVEVVVGGLLRHARTVHRYEDGSHTVWIILSFSYIFLVNCIGSSMVIYLLKRVQPSDKWRSN